jgi:hypothetical protein
MGLLRRPRSASRWLAGSLGALLLGQLLAVGALSRSPGRVVADHRTGYRAQGRVQPAPKEQTTAEAIQRLLDRRAAAVLRHDRADFLATVDPAAHAFRDAQARLFAALAAVPLRSWSYQVAPAGERQLPANRRDGYAAPTYVPDVVRLHYQLRGFDDRPTSVPMYLTFVRRPAGWLLGSDRDLDRTGIRTAREPWDFGPVQVVTGRRSLILGHPGSGRLLAGLAAEADSAVPAVTSVWGTGWRQRVVVVLPAGTAELRGLLSDDRDVSQLAAVATAWSAQTPAAEPVGQRVLLNPVNFNRLRPIGRRVVLIHEITHVAARDATGAATPTWLTEGFADYVAYRGTGAPPRTVAAELAADVAAGRLPSGLPGDARFAGAGSRLPQAYEEAWLACRLIADSAGASGLVRFYRETAATGDRSAVLTRAFRDVLATTPAAFTTRWRGYLRAQLS